MSFKTYQHLLVHLRGLKKMNSHPDGYEVGYIVVLDLHLTNDCSFALLIRL